MIRNSQSGIFYVLKLKGEHCMDIGNSDFSDYDEAEDYLNIAKIELCAFCVKVNTSP